MKSTTLFMFFLMHSSLHSIIQLNWKLGKKTVYYISELINLNNQYPVIQQKVTTIKRRLRTPKNLQFQGVSRIYLAFTTKIFAGHSPQSSERFSQVQKSLL